MTRVHACILITQQELHLLLLKADLRMSYLRITRRRLLIFQLVSPSEVLYKSLLNSSSTLPT